MTATVRHALSAPSRIVLDLHTAKIPSHLFARTQASVLLDLVRGLAALLVFVSHWRNFFFDDYPNLAKHNPATALFYLLTSGGHQAVVIFFVLSGYLISGSVFRIVERGAWSWPTYLLHRLVRLWVVLVPGLLLCLFWDRLGLTLHLAPILYAGASLNHMTPDVRVHLAAPVFTENLFFLQGIAGRPMFGSDGALWSLANEFWYYLLFPLGLVALWRPSKYALATPFVRLLCAALFLLIAWFVRGGILWMFPVWLAGTLLCLVPPPRCGARTRQFAALAYIPILYIIAKWQSLPILYADYLLTAATVALLYTLLSATHPPQPSPAIRASRKLARCSYTLYVVHMPFLVLLTALAAHDTRWRPDLPHLAEALGCLILTLAYAYLIASATEFHTDSIRRWLERTLHLAR